MPPPNATSAVSLPTVNPYDYLHTLSLHQTYDLLGIAFALALIGLLLIEHKVVRGVMAGLVRTVKINTHVVTSEVRTWK